MFKVHIVNLKNVHFRIGLGYLNGYFFRKNYSSFFIILVLLDEINKIKFIKNIRDLTIDSTQILCLSAILSITLECFLCLCEAVIES